MCLLNTDSWCPLPLYQPLSACEAMLSRFSRLRPVPFPRGFLLASLSGVLLTLSIPKVDWWPLAWVAFVPVLIALYDARQPENTKRVYTIGLTFGFVSGVGKVYWVTETVVSYGGLGWVLGLFSMAMVALLLASYALVFSLFAARTNWRNAAFPLLAASLWTALEYLQTYLFTGFPWELLGYSQHRVLTVIQISRWTGVYGVSFLVLLVNATLALYFVGIRDGFQWRTPVRALGITTALMIATVGYGWYALNATHTNETQTPVLRVAVAQGNVQQHEKWSAGRLQKTINTYTLLTLDALKQKPDLIVFPETAMTFYLENPTYQAFTRQVTDLVDAVRVPLLTGALGFDVQKKGEIYNSAFLLVPKQGVVARYSKSHLVPFGEYIPFTLLFSWLEKLTLDTGVLTPGDGPTVMDVPGGELSLGTAICYESIFPDLVRRFVLNGANVLVVITNDAWFGDSSAPRQHFSMAVFRAVENATPVVRAANTGISGYISATGQTFGLTPLNRSTTTIGDLYPRREGPTPYTRFGDVFSWLCVAASLVGIVVTGRSSKQ